MHQKHNGWWRADLYCCLEEEPVDLSTTRIVPNVIYDNGRLPDDLSVGFWLALVSNDRYHFVLKQLFAFLLRPHKGVHLVSSAPKALGHLYRRASYNNVVDEKEARVSASNSHLSQHILILLLQIRWWTFSILEVLVCFPWQSKLCCCVDDESALGSLSLVYTVGLLRRSAVAFGTTVSKSLYVGGGGDGYKKIGGLPQGQ